MSKPHLWTPKSDDTPKFLCRICKTGFLTTGAMERHVLGCADPDKLDEIRARRNAPKDRFYQPVDPEWDAYNRALERAGINPEVQYARGRKSGIRRASES